MFSMKPGSRYVLATCTAIICAGGIAAFVWSGQRPNSSDASEARHDAVALVGLTGVVSEESGSPIAATDLCIQGIDHGNRLEGVCTTTDRRGVYRFDMLPGQYAVTASAINRRSVSSVVTLEKGSKTLDFILAKQPPTIAGSVHSASGERLSTARVVVYQDELPVATTTTDDAGAFVVWAPAGPLAVKAEAVGFGPTLIRTIAPTMDIDITLYPENVVAGQVLLEGSLQAVPNVRVTASSRPDRIVAPLRDVTVRTDERGGFVFTGLTAGSWSITVSDQNLWGTLPAPVAVTLGEQRSDLTLLVQPAGTVSGKLSMANGNLPCSSGRIQFIPEAAFDQNGKNARPGQAIVSNDISQAAFTSEVDSEGTIHFDAIPFGSYRIGPVCDEHQYVAGPLRLTIDTEKISNLLWTFHEGIGVTARVTDDTGRPLPHVTVTMSPLADSVLSRGQWVRMQRSGITDDRGLYRFGGLRPGSYQVTAQRAGVNSQSAASTSITVVETEAPEPITLSLPSTGAILIRARTKTAKPISRILFFASDSAGARFEATYKGDGYFVVDHLVRGSYRVFGYDNKNAKMLLNNGVPIDINDATPVEISFEHEPPTAVLEGRVTDSAGAPLPGTLIRAVSTTLDENDELYSVIQSHSHGHQELMTDRNGRFRVEELNARAAYDLYVDHPSGLEDVRRQVFPGSFVEIALPDGAAVAGHVVDGSGKAVVNFDVVVSNLDTNATRAKSFSNAQGQFKIDNLSPGRMQVTVYDEDGELSADRQASVNSGQTLNIGYIALSARGATEISAEASNVR